MREAVICFRTSEELRKALEKIADGERRSLSSVIEHILYDYVEVTEPKGVKQEKRRHPRKKLSAPALVTGPDGVVHAGMVHDISAGGIRVAISPGLYEEAGEELLLSVVFTLPQTEKPLTVRCKARDVHSDGQTVIRAAFVDADFQSYQSLGNYLMD